MEAKVTSKNTKNQILEAYEELLQQQAQREEEPKKVQEQQKKTELVNKAKELSHQSIVKGINELKISAASSLDSLGEQFAAEYGKFEELQKAIEAEKDNLKDLYELTVNTDSLSTMLLLQKQQKEDFEQEMQESKAQWEGYVQTEKDKFEEEISKKRLQWKKEQEEREAKQKEAADELKKMRIRDEEEYGYNLKIARKKEEDAYEDKRLHQEKELNDQKMAFENMIAERQSKLKEAEAELEQLRIQSRNFPEKLDKAVSEAIAQTKQQLTNTFKFETELKAKEVEGELKLKEQTISTLNAKIKEMEKSLETLSKKTATAESSVKDIAMRAIESSSKTYVVEKNKENSITE